MHTLKHNIFEKFQQKSIADVQKLNNLEHGNYKNNN